MKQETHDVIVEAIKGATAVIGTIVSAMTLSQLLGIATLLYVIVQLVYLLRKWWREEKELARKERADLALCKQPVDTQ